MSQVKHKLPYEFKYSRVKKVPGNKPGKVRKVTMVFLVPGDSDREGFICPAGPGRKPIPAEGRWYELTTYLQRRVNCGDAKEAKPPRKTERVEVTVKATPTKVKKGPEPKEG